jgi:iron(III) transport system permease protein
MLALRLTHYAVPKPNWRTIFLAAVVALVAYLVLVPMALVLAVSFRVPSIDVLGSGFTFDNYRRALFNNVAAGLVFNTAVYTVGSATIGLFFGVGFAWLVERTNVPFRHFAYPIVPLNAAIPGVLFAIAWVLLLSPRIGVYNLFFIRQLGWNSGPFSPYTLPAMTVVEGFRATSIVFLLMIGLFRSMDPSLEEAAATSRAGTLRTLSRVTLPLMLPGILGVLLFTSTGLIGTFEIPGIMGMPGGVYVFSTRIWLASSRVPRDFGVAGALSVLIICLAVVGILLYHRVLRSQRRYATVTGKGFRPRVMDLGSWRFAGTAAIALYFIVVVVMPLLVLVWASLQRFYQAPSIAGLQHMTTAGYTARFNESGILEAIGNTAILLAVVPIVTMVLSAVMSWIIVRSQAPGRKMLDILGFLPQTMPSIAIGLAFSWVYLIFSFIPIYGTIWIIALGFITFYLAFGTRTMNAAMFQLHQELEEAGAMSGADWFRTFRKITLPLLLPSLIGGWLWVAMQSVRELSMALMLYTPSSRIISVMIWDVWENGHVPEVAALGVLLTAFIAALLLAGRLVAMRSAREF